MAVAGLGDSLQAEERRSLNDPGDVGSAMSIDENDWGNGSL